MTKKLCLKFDDRILDDIKIKDKMRFSWNSVNKIDIVECEILVDFIEMNRM